MCGIVGIALPLGARRAGRPAAHRRLSIIDLSAAGRQPMADASGTVHLAFILLRRLAACLLPKELDLRRKQGFSIPLHRWFDGPWGRFMEDGLSDADPSLFDCEDLIP